MARLRALPDRKIVVDDENPAWSVEDFARGVWRRGLQPVPPKQLVSLRIDADVLAWFRAQGRGYQSRMNALLRAFMEAQEEKPGR